MAAGDDDSDYEGAFDGVMLGADDEDDEVQIVRPLDSETVAFIDLCEDDEDDSDGDIYAAADVQQLAYEPVRPAAVHRCYD